MTLCCALHTVGRASSPRAATIDVRPLNRLCTADWSPLGDCYAGAPQPGGSLMAHVNVKLLNSGLLDACHPEALRCFYQATNDYMPGVDCFGTAVVAVSHEVDAYAIDEYIYGDPAAQQANQTSRDDERTDCYCEYGCDEFDCGIVYQPKIYREDISKLASDPRHSSGLQVANEINAKNDGLSDALVASVRQSVAPRIAAHVGANYDYGDCNDDCREDCELTSSDRLVHDLGDLCGAGHCRVEADKSSAVVSLDKEPLDLPPAEPAAIDPSEYGYEADYSYEAEYGYEADYGYEYEHNYEDDYSYNEGDDYSYNDEDDYSFGYEDDYSYSATSEYESAESGDDYGYGYTDDESYAYEDVHEPADLPPAEQLIDDMPPGEALTDDMPPGESLAAQASYDPYDVECYGDYRDCQPTQGWVEPGCDAEQSYAAEDWCEGLNGNRTWGVGREYRQTAVQDEPSSRELLRSTARALHRLGETLVKLAESIDEEVAPVAESQPAMPAGEFYPWPATIGRNPKIDPPLGL
jgi:hypothetical protein